MGLALAAAKCIIPLWPTYEVFGSVCSTDGGLGGSGEELACTPTLRHWPRTKRRSFPRCSVIRTLRLSKGDWRQGVLCKFRESQLLDSRLPIQGLRPQEFYRKFRMGLAAEEERARD